MLKENIYLSKSTSTVHTLGKNQRFNVLFQGRLIMGELQTF